MASSGPLYGRTAANDAGVGSVAWQSLSGAEGASWGEGAYAYADGITSSALSNYLKITNFSFAIPSSATVDGIVVEWQGFGKSDSETKTDNVVRLWHGGAVAGTDKADATAWTNGSFNTKSYGGSADPWGLSLTGADVNSSGFGVVYSGKSSSGTGSYILIDGVRVTVYYTVAASGGMTPRRRSSMRTLRAM